MPDYVLLDDMIDDLIDDISCIKLNSHLFKEEDD